MYLKEVFLIDLTDYWLMGQDNKTPYLEKHHLMFRIMALITAYMTIYY
jgi:hypothetical protein